LIPSELEVEAAIEPRLYRRVLSLNATLDCRAIAFLGEAYSEGTIGRATNSVAWPCVSRVLVTRVGVAYRTMCPGVVCACPNGNIASRQVGDVAPAENDEVISEIGWIFGLRQQDLHRVDLRSPERQFPIIDWGLLSREATHESGNPPAISQLDGRNNGVMGWEPTLKHRVPRRVRVNARPASWHCSPPRAKPVRS
jgi:hypothetical protein